MLGGEVDPAACLGAPFAAGVSDAVARLKASQLPAKVTLTDAMAMTPAMTLSKFPKVSVAARISKSGNAMPQAGDLESARVEVTTDSRAPVALTIDKVD